MKFLTEALLDSSDVNNIDRDLLVAVARDLRSLVGGSIVETDPIFTAWFATGTPIGDSVWSTGSLGAISFIRVNADDTVTARLASDVLTDIGALSSASTSIQDGYFGSLFLKDAISPSNYLRIVLEDDLTADRLLYINVSDGNKTLTLTGNASIEGTNTGDQSTIVGISGTKAEYNTSLSDGDFLFVGDVTAYTDEEAQDAVGAMVDTTLVYDDGIPLLTREALAGAITAARGSNATLLGSFSRAELDAAVSDADILYVGDITSYTDEMAQDAVGAMVDTSLVYDDVTPRFSRAALTGAITASVGSNTIALGSFTKAELDAAVSDGNVLYVGDVTQYTDEMAQDAIGAMINTTLVYVDGTPLLARAALTGAITVSQTSNVTSLGSFTKAQLTTAVSDGDPLYVGDITQYTDELAQDAIGSMIDSSLVYVDATPLLTRAALTGAITASQGSNTTALGSFTKAQLDTAVSDGNVLYVGDVTQYTDELAQDAIGAMIDSTLVYVDGTPLLTRAALTGDVTASQGSNATVNVGSSSVYKWTGTQTDTTSTGTLNDYALSATVTELRFNSPGAVIIFRGMDPGATPDGRLVRIIQEDATTTFVINNESGTSTAAMRIHSVSTLQLGQWDSVLLKYDGLQSRWTVAGIFHSYTSSSDLTGNIVAPVIANNKVTYAKMQDVTATQRLIGRNTAGSGDPEEVTMTQGLDWIGSTQGQVLYRGSANWTALAVGALGQALITGAGSADPAWGYANSIAGFVGPSGTIANTETKIFSSDVAMSASRLVVGSTITVRLRGTSSAGASPGAPIFRVRYGTAATTADGQILSFTLGTAPTTGTTIAWSVDIVFTVRTTGAAATCDGTLTLVNQGITGLSTTATQVIRGSASTFNTTTATTFFTVTFISGSTNESIIVQDAEMHFANK